MRDKAAILLVEDDKIDAKNVLRAFKENNISNPIYLTTNGEEALKYLRNDGEYGDPRDAPRPSLILLDINMPIMNGIEFLKVVKQDPSLRTIPVVMLTTSQEESDRVESYQLGVAGFIVKPVDFYSFVDAVRVIDLYWTLSELA